MSCGPRSNQSDAGASDIKAQTSWTVGAVTTILGALLTVVELFH